MSSKSKILFLCGHNSCRSQMAEGFLRHYGEDQWDAWSAGIRSKGVHPLSIKVMAEKGIDISGQQSKLLADVMKQNTFDTVVSVCAAADQECPTYLAPRRRLSWPFDDPDKATGSEEEVLAVFRRVRDEIENAIKEFLAERISTRAPAVQQDS